jgi:hypothetical protein
MSPKTGNSFEWNEVARKDPRAIARKKGFHRSLTVKEPPEGTPCQLCPERQPQKALFMGWHFHISFKKLKNGTKRRLPSKQEFIPLCRNHWLERMHNLYPYCCPSKRCMKAVARQASLRLDEKDYLYYIPLFAMIGPPNFVLKCPHCQRPMIQAYEAPWTEIHAALGNLRQRKQAKKARTIHSVTFDIKVAPSFQFVDNSKSSKPKSDLDSPREVQA